MRTKYIFKSNSFLILWFSNISTLFPGCQWKEILSHQRIRHWDLTEYIFRLRSRHHQLLLKYNFFQVYCHILLRSATCLEECYFCQKMLMIFYFKILNFASSRKWAFTAQMVRWYCVVAHLRGNIVHHYLFRSFLCDYFRSGYRDSSEESNMFMNWNNLSSERSENV